jgi:transposase InsO family protein
LREPNLGKTNPRVTLFILLAICFAPSLADSFIFLTLTRLVVVFIFVNFRFALFTPPSRRLSRLLCGGLDFAGPLQKAPGGFTHLLVAIDKFSKWIEVRPLNSIRSEQAVAFFTNIIHCFGVPNSIITDNGTQFTGKKFLDFCEDHHIRVDWAAVAHPMTNVQVERANDMILQGLKPRIYNDLNKFGRRWMKELPSVVWSLRTTPSRATGFTPFFLVYGAEAILPTDLEYGSPRTRAYDNQSNQTSQEDSLDQLQEAQDMALLHSARYQQSLRRYRARGVRSRDLQVGDLVLRLRQDARGRHKLTPPWEGPFIISKILKPGTYKLANSQGEVYNNAWNIRHLCRFYP